MSAVPEMSNITIREIEKLAEMRAVEELQKEIWGIPDLDVVPLTHLVAAKEAGGVLIGAFDGETVVGFVYGFPSFEHGDIGHHSHMLAVKPAYRNFELGRRLKLAQREHVMAQQIDLISWTFDPLQSLNAHFNFGKLGVLADRYLPNFYGEDAASFLHQTGTDRLWVTWLVSSERVQWRISGGSYHFDVNLGPPLVQVEADDSPRRNDLTEALGLEHAAIEIPSNIDSLQRETALRWREDTRWAFTEALKARYYVDAFIRETRGDKRSGKYILRKGIWTAERHKRISK
jgi:predicted GNAT superfamily acetyltransferase